MEAGVEAHPYRGRRKENDSGNAPAVFPTLTRGSNRSIW